MNQEPTGNFASPPQDHRSNEELIRAALALEPDREDDRYRLLIRALQYRMDDSLLVRLSELCRSNRVNERILAADIFGQGHVGEKRLREECTRTLLEVLAQESETGVLVAVGDALGQLGASVAVPALARLKSHPEASVRLAAVHGLLCQESPLAIEALVDLSSDPDRDVRNWAIFGIGSMIETNSPEIRDALANRLDEPDEEIRGEAIVGLARRGDLRMVEPLLQELKRIESGDLDFGDLVIEAAEAARKAANASRDSQWTPLMVRLDELGLGKAEN